MIQTPPEDVYAGSTVDYLEVYDDGVPMLQICPMDGGAYYVRADFLRDWLNNCLPSKAESPTEGVTEKAKEG